MTESVQCVWGWWQKLCSVCEGSDRNCAVAEKQPNNEEKLLAVGLFMPCNWSKWSPWRNKADRRNTWRPSSHTVSKCKDNYEKTECSRGSTKLCLNKHQWTASKYIASSSWRNSSEQGIKTIPQKWPTEKMCLRIKMMPRFFLGK